MDSIRLTIHHIYGTSSALNIEVASPPLARIGQRLLRKSLKIPNNFYVKKEAENGVKNRHIITIS
jgi:hypothetical protein